MEQSETKQTIVEKISSTSSENVTVMNDESTMIDSSMLLINPIYIKLDDSLRIIFQVEDFFKQLEISDKNLSLN